MLIQGTDYHEQREASRSFAVRKSEGIGRVNDKEQNAEVAERLGRETGPTPPETGSNDNGERCQGKYGVWPKRGLSRRHLLVGISPERNSPECPRGSFMVIFFEVNQITITPADIGDTVRSINLDVCLREHPLDARQCTSKLNELIAPVREDGQFHMIGAEGDSTKCEQADLVRRQAGEQLVGVSRDSSILI